MNTLPDHIFRGYDIRGVVDKDLDEENVYILGQAYATWLLNRRIYDCVVGYDCRLSSPGYYQAMTYALMQAGITVYDIGLTLSQIAYFAQYLFRTRGMVMITASHNPKEYNGFKLGSGFSETMLTKDIQDLKSIAQSQKFHTAAKKGNHVIKDVFEDYLNDLKRHILLESIAPMRVVIDSCAATTGVFLPRILRAYGCDVIEQNIQPDGNFPVGTPDPTEASVQKKLADRVKAEKADIGFSYDADGDRIGVVDEEGNLIWNDTLCSLYAQDILESLPGSKIVFNTLCSKQVDEVIRLSGGEAIMWMTGHSFIKSKVRETGAPFGGELSGHFYFVDNFYGHDDGAVSTLRLLSYLTRTKQSLRNAVRSLPQYISSPEIKVGCPDGLKLQVVQQLTQQVKAAFPHAEYVEIDGIRVDTESAMLVIRASQNGPYLTVKFEAKADEEYHTIKTMISNMLHKNRDIDFQYGVNLESLL